MRIGISEPGGAGPSARVALFHDAATGSLSYVFSDPATGAAAVVDPVLDFEPASATVSTRSADELLAYVREAGLRVEIVLDTHPHADHFSAARYLKERTGAPIAIGERVARVQEIWKEIYALPDFPADGSQWDRTFADGDAFEVGSLPVRVMLSTGHTLASISYLVGADAAFVHDTLMMPDAGTARCDFPGGDAGELYDSLTAILALPDHTRLFVGHDYCPGGRAPAGEATVAAHRAGNIHLAGGTDRAAFVALREERDATLPLPDRMLAALQVNMNGMRLPEPDGAGRRFLKIPLDRFPDKA